MSGKSKCHSQTGSYVRNLPGSHKRVTRANGSTTTKQRVSRFRPGSLSSTVVVIDIFLLEHEYTVHPIGIYNVTGQ